MKTAIIGPGPLGTLLAANLSRSKNEVILLDKDIEKEKKSSLIGSSDAIFICVKSYDTEAVIKSIKNFIKDNSYVISLQSGIGNLQIISEYVDTGRIIGGITSQGQTIIGQGSGKVLGGIREISSLLTKANFPTKITKDINSVTWSKLIIDAGINALSAITRLKNGVLVKNEHTRDIMRRAVSEAVKVAKRKKVKLTYDDPIQKVESVCRATADEQSPMLQDLIGRRQTEIEFINGAVIRQAKNLNIKTPVNDMLTEFVKSIEENYKNIVN
ncbi:MAG: 2-dehydropantoate 2-reductase [Candidatus Omnitrophica bacterium]|nr:2-dehydropantoate 2-reductase [Candidatus Omnitrophota bacterium]